MNQFIPFARIEAEISAWPLWSEYAVACPSSSLLRNQHLVLEAHTLGLAASLEQHMQLRSGGASLETLRQLRDFIWFAEVDEQPLVDYVDRLASLHLRLAGDHVELAANTEDATCALRWRWLSLALPPDLLIAALNSDAESVTLLPAELRSMQQPPFAEIHCHLGACTTFSWLWTVLMLRCAGNLGIEEIAVGTAPFGSAAVMSDWLTAAALVRATLGGLLHYHQGSPDLCLTEYLTEEFTNFADVAAHRRVLTAVSQGQRPPPAAETQALYRRFTGLPEKPELGCRRDLHEQDPLGAWLGAAHETLPESVFLRRALNYLRGSGREDDAFAQLFWQYVRVRGRLYRYLVHEPGVSGLDWFTMHFARRGSLHFGFGDAQMELAWALQSRGIHLASLEVRTVPPESRSSVVKLVRRVAQPDVIDGNTRRPLGLGAERGLVLHFSRHKRRNAETVHADPRQDHYNSRYGTYFKARSKQARAIEAAINGQPNLLLVLRCWRSSKSVEIWTGDVNQEAAPEAEAAWARLDLADCSASRRR